MTSNTEAMTDRNLLVTVELEHPELTKEIGRPALLKIRETNPAVRILAEEPGWTVTAVLERGMGSSISLGMKQLIPGEEIRFGLEGFAEAAGLHVIRLSLAHEGGRVCYEAFYYTVTDSDPAETRIVYPGPDGKLVYVPDYKGNRIADFSMAGYEGGGVELPEIEAVVVVDPAGSDSGEDDTERVQAAIDYASELPLQPNGFRGAVLLRRGTYRIGGTLKIAASGVVLRGEGHADGEGTLLYATGAGRRDMLVIGGMAGVKAVAGSGTRVTDLYVPVGACSFHVEDPTRLRIGDTVIVKRYGNHDWIHEIGMDAITPRPVTGGTKMWEPFELDFDRVIVGLEGNFVTVDAPITCAIESRWGGAEVLIYDDPGRIERVGVEQLRIDSEFDSSVTDTQHDGKLDVLPPYTADENHAVNFVVMNHVKNAWVRDVTGVHLEHSLVTVDYGAKWVTVEDCTVLDMVSIITGGRRYCFHLCGQLTLVHRCRTETGRHAYVVDKWVPGPNVFLHCESSIDYGASEPHHRWSVGGLYDNVKAPISIQDRIWFGSGHGWSGANYVAWNTEGNLILQQPPTAQNYAIGHIGNKLPGVAPNEHDPRPRKEGYWESLGEHVEPQSLYLQQLYERLQK